MYEIFEPQNDLEYLNWIRINPDGFVANMSRNPSPYFVLHRASCSNATTRSYNSKSKDAFVGAHFRKKCCIDGQVLFDLEEHASASDRRLCKNCAPLNGVPTPAQAIERARTILGTSSGHFEALQEVAIGNSNPRRIEQKTYQYVRDPRVVAHALDRANGDCEACGANAPFVRLLPNGQPYLEVHHIVPLAEGGPDTIENVIALCPNCHREVHHGNGGLKARLTHSVADPTLVPASPRKAAD